MKASCFLVLAATAFLFADSLVACSCGQTPTAAESLGRASDVFEGQAGWLEAVWASQPGLDLKMPLHGWRFQVLTVWKGKSRGQALIVDGEGNCSFQFRPGARYLVFANAHPSEPGALHTTICTATQELQVGQSGGVDLGPGVSVQAVGHLGSEPLFSRVWRTLKTAVLMGWDYPLYWWQRLDRIGSPWAIVSQYGACLIAVVLIYAGVKASVLDHLKIVGFVAVSLVLLAGAALLVGGYFVAVHNPYFRDLVELGG